MTCNCIGGPNCCRLRRDAYVLPYADPRLTGAAQIPWNNSTTFLFGDPRQWLSAQPLDTPPLNEDK